MAPVFVPGKASQTEAYLKGTCRLRHHGPERKPAQPKGRRRFCRSAAFRSKGHTLRMPASTAPCGYGKIVRVGVTVIWFLTRIYG